MTIKESCKRLAIIGTALTLTAPSFATNPDNFSGPYIGAGFGGIIADSQVKTAIFDNSNKQSLSGRGLSGDIHVGWGTILKSIDQFPLYTALEFSGDLTKARGSNRNQDDWYKLERKQGLEVAMKIGVPANSMLPYVKIGAKRSDWKLTSYIAAPSTSANDPKLTHKTRTLSGLTIGVGVQTHIGSRFLLGGEYNYGRYKPFKHNHGRDTATYKITSRTHQLLLKVSYLFKTLS